MTLIELPRRRSAPRVFVDAPAGLQRKVTRALSALGDLPDGFDHLPGLAELSGALIDIADAIDGDADAEPDADDEPEPEELPLFAFAGLPPRPP